MVEMGVGQNYRAMSRAGTGSIFSVAHALHSWRLKKAAVNEQLQPGWCEESSRGVDEMF